MIELFDRMHEAHIALLDQIEEVQRALAVILPRNRDHETQVSLHHLLARRLDLAPRPADLRDDVAEVGNG